LRAFCLTIILTLALVAPGLAAAQTPTDDIYSPMDKRESQSQSQGEAHADSSGLPYTGGEIGLVLLAGGVILGTGVAIRRASRTQ
jgi:hypothetical protein